MNMNWKLVSDQLPKNGQRVVAKYEGVYEPRIVTFWMDGVNTHFSFHNEKDGKGSQPATHWAEVPQ